MLGLTLAMALSLISSTRAAPAPPPPDIRCEAQGSYIGNLIDMDFKLSITGAREHRWEYVFTNKTLRPMKPSVLTGRGTYEFSGDLVIFTGRIEDSSLGPRGTTDVRFGLNVGSSAAGGVIFDAFFPREDGSFGHHRKLFRKSKDGWQPADERALTLRSLSQTETRWQVEISGERTRWDTEGKPTRETIVEKFTYRKGDNNVWHQDQPPLSWIPWTLTPWKEKGRVGLIQAGLEYSAPGSLRGFHPSIGTLADQPERRR